MRKLGLIGGTSWRSTSIYYRTINELVNEYFGNNTNPPLTVENLNQFEIHSLQREGRWSDISEIYVSKIRDMEKSGCDGVLFCANTPYIMFDEIRKSVSVEILHIADAVGRRAAAMAARCVGFLGTVYSTKSDIYGEKLKENFGIDVLYSGNEDVILIDEFIKKELTFGILQAETIGYFRSRCEEFFSRGLAPWFSVVRNFRCCLPHCPAAFHCWIPRSSTAGWAWISFLARIAVSSPSE